MDEDMTDTNSDKVNATRYSARHHFASMDRAEQAAAVRRMATSGHSDHTIASASGLAVEEVRRLLGDRVRAIGVEAAA